MTLRDIVVVGTGVAGLTAVSTLRQQGYDGRLTLVGSEPHAPYHRPTLSKQVLRGDKPLDAISLKPLPWYDAQRVDPLTRTTVTEVDPVALTVTLAYGGRLPYDALVLATGGRPVTLPLAQVEGVHLLRTAADLPALQLELHPGVRLVVVGAGFLGAEVAASAVALGCAVTLLEAGTAPLGRVLPPVVAGFYADLHRSHGVDLRTGVALADVERVANGLQVSGADGGTWEADVVVLAVGQRPDTTLAAAAGLAVSDGICVDAFGRTSVPGIWAAGDAAAFPDRVTGVPRRLEHWQAAMTQGATVGADVLGLAQPWTEVPWCWSDQHGVNLQVCGNPRGDDNVTLRGSPERGSFTAVTSRGDRLTGAIGVDRASDIRALRRLLATAPEISLSLLADDSLDLAGLLPSA